MTAVYLPDLVWNSPAGDLRRTAIVDVHGEVSYLRLWQRVGRAVRQLRSAGVRPGDRVGIYMPRSADYVTALLAVTTMGAVAVPMDPEFPADRLDGMCAAARPRAMLHAESDAPAGIGDAPWLCLDHSRAGPGLAPGEELAPGEGTWRERAADSQPAVILFTSGSTGRPKGVVLHHAGLANRLEWGQRTWGFDAADRVLHKASTAFDAAIHEIFAPLIAGGTLVIAPPGLQFDSRGLVRLIREAEVSTAHFVPSVLRYVLDEAEFRYCTSLRRVFCGGEALDIGLVRRVRELLGCQLVNLYGPTETSVNATTWDCSEPFDGAIAPIGRPIDNVTCYVLGKDLAPVPAGHTGELWIGGRGVAAGYLNDAALTARRFLPNPRGPGRIYRTGDLVRLAAAGYLEFRGRIDDQVKVRGVRVEPEEVTGAIRQHPLLQDAAVVGAPDGAGGVRLVAYVVARRANSPVVAGLRRIRLPNGQLVATPSPDETMFLYRQIFEEDEYARFGIRIGPGDLVVDVGANIGLFSLWAHGRAPGVRVLAIEPNPDVLPYLRLNLELNDVPAQVVPVAVTDRAGTATLTSFPGLTYLSGLGSNRVAEAAGLIRSHIAHAPASSPAAAGELAELRRDAAGRLVATSRPVSTTGLSAVLDQNDVDQVGLLKINVEGAELSVLGGIRPEHWMRIKQVCIEVEHAATSGPLIVSTLRRAGYTVHTQRDWMVSQDADVSYVYATREPGPPPASPGWHARRQPQLLTARELHRHAASLLPPAMRPSQIIFMEALPRLPNGKVSRRDLPQPDLPDPREAAAVSGAAGSPREILREIWRTALATDQVNDDDDFVSLGGHSLLALRVATRVRQVTGAEISPSGCLRAVSFAQWAGEVLRACGTVRA